MGDKQVERELTGEPLGGGFVRIHIKCVHCLQHNLTRLLCMPSRT